MALEPVSLAHDPVAVGVLLDVLVRPAPRSRLVRPDARRLRRATRPSGVVVAEAALGLAAEVAGGDQVLEQRRRREAGLAELQVELALDRQRHVVADHVEQLERAHRQRAAVLHRGVDVVGGGVVRLEHLHRVVEVGEQQRVDDEAGPVAARDRDLADLRAQRAGGLGDVVGGGDRGDDLDQLHDRRRVEEVHAR